MKYINIDLNSSTPPKCQCGAYLIYDEQTNRLSCSNSNCIKTRLKSVLCTLQALDRLTIDAGHDYKLTTLAKNNYDLLEQFVQTCDIKYGIELITKGVDLTTLGELGIHLANIIDTFEFKLSDLSSLCGSQLLTQLHIDFSTLPRGDKRLAIAKINEQLGIDGSVLLATLIYDDFEMYFNSVMELTDYITLYRPSTKKRSTIPIVLNVPDDISYDSELTAESKENILAVESAAQQVTTANTEQAEGADDDTANTSLMEELFEW